MSLSCWLHSVFVGRGLAGKSYSGMSHSWLSSNGSEEALGNERLQVVLLVQHFWFCKKNY